MPLLLLTTSPSRSTNQALLLVPQPRLPLLRCGVLPKSPNSTGLGKGAKHDVLTLEKQALLKGGGGKRRRRKEWGKGPFLKTLVSKEGSRGEGGTGRRTSLLLEGAGGQNSFLTL